MEGNERSFKFQVERMLNLPLEIRNLQLLVLLLQIPLDEWAVGVGIII